MLRIHNVARPLRMLHQLYTRPVLTATKTQVRLMSEVEDERTTIEKNRLRSVGWDDPNCEQCESRANQGVNQEQKQAAAKEKTPGVGSTEHAETDMGDFLDHWRDPLTVKIQLANPPEEEVEGTEGPGHNISMI